MTANPYRAAGTFSGPAYTEREADRDLRRAIEQNQRFPYMLAPRQSGKSSALIHLRAGLDPARFRCGFADLSIFRPEELGDYDRFLVRFFGDLARSLDVPAPSVQGRPMADLLALLAAIPGPRVVLLIDEVDALRGSPFKDTFFSDIRSLFNDRATVTELVRVQFVLSGAARVEELITDAARSPFNVGKSIQLNDFTLAEVTTLCAPLAALALPLPADLPVQLYHHTSGSPYLTQLLLEQLWDSLVRSDGDPPAPGAILTRIDALADGIVAGAALDIHFRNIAESVERDPKALRLWRQAVAGAPLSELEWERLRITGIAGRDHEAVYRNRICERVFANRRWTIAQMPLRRFTPVTVVAMAAMILAFAGLINVWFASREQSSIVKSATREERILGLVERIVQANQDVPTAAYEALRKLDRPRADELMAGYWDRRSVEAEQTGTRDEAIILRLKAVTVFNTSERRLATRANLESPTSKIVLTFRHEAEVINASFNERGSKFVTTSGYIGTLGRYNSSYRAFTEPKQREAFVGGANLSRDGRKVVMANALRTAQLWDATTGKPLGEPMRLEPSGSNVVWVATARGLFVLFDDNSARLWSATTGKPLGEPLRHEDYVLSANFSADGSKVVTASRDQTARLWDATTGSPLGEPMRHDASVLSASFSADDRKIVTASEDKTARLWDAATGSPLGEPMRHNASVLSASFSADGGKIVTTSEDKTARIWDATSGKPLGQPILHEGSVESADFCVDGSKLVTASGDKTARLWDAITGKPLGPPMRHAARLTTASFSADGNKVVTASDDNTARVWDATTGKPLGETIRHEGSVRSASFRADSSEVLTVSDDKTARLSDASTGKPLGETIRHDASIRSVSFSADGGKVATASNDNTVRLWDAVTGKPLGKAMHHDDAVFSASFSADGQKVVTTSADHTARLWDATTGKPLGEPMRHEDWVLNASLGADGRKVVTTSADHTARLWDAITGKPLAEPMLHENWVSSASFNADASMVVTASWDNTARLWDAITGKPLGEPMRHEASVLSASFSADSRKVVTTNSDKTARLWDATTGKPLGEPMRHDAPPGSSRFSADGRWTITETDSRIRWWERLDETRYRLAGIRWTRGIKWIGEPWVSPDGRDVKAAELFTGDSVVVRTLRLGAGDPDLPALTGSPAELLAEWQRRLALKFEDETRSPKLVPMYGLPSGSAPLRRPLPDKTP